MSRIGIVGAGLSGRLLALNLLRIASPDRRASIVMFDRGDALSMGPAYSDESDYLLLNVPTGRMGAFSEDPEHFLTWLQDRGTHVGRWDFLPRILFRDYILALMHEAVEATAGSATLEHVRGEVTDVAVVDGGATIQLGNERAFAVDKAVLALGNFPPRQPNIESRPNLQSKRYVHAPWDVGVILGLEERDTVFFIGTGQTTVDLMVALHRRGHRGQIVAISRRGLLPLVHRGFEVYPSFFEEIEQSQSILEIFRVVRRHLEGAASDGIDRRAVIDSLRPHTQAIWRSLPEDEKRRFVRHVFRYWEIIRSRIPPESERLIDDLRVSGQLRIVAGRVQDLVETEGAIEVRYVARGSTTTQVESAALVINCIGPESDYERIDHPLIRNLLRRQLIRSGPAHLGIDALPNGAILEKGGAASDVLYTLGSTMKGVLWEVLAVPEIRVQAEQLAHLLLGDAPRSTPPSGLTGADGDRSSSA